MKNCSRDFKGDFDSSSVQVVSVLKGLEHSSIPEKIFVKSSRDGSLWISRVGPAGVCGV